MKVLKYQLLTQRNLGSDENPVFEELLSDVVMGWNEENEIVAGKEAYQHRYEITEDPSFF